MEECKRATEQHRVFLCESIGDYSRRLQKYERRIADFRKNLQPEIDFCEAQLQKYREQLVEFEKGQS